MLFIFTSHSLHEPERKHVPSSYISRCLWGKQAASHNIYLRKELLNKLLLHPLNEVKHGANRKWKTRTVEAAECTSQEENDTKQIRRRFPALKLPVHLREKTFYLGENVTFSGSSLTLMEAQSSACVWDGGGKSIHSAAD